jgi:hypothetical protein
VQALVKERQWTSRFHKMVESSLSSCITGSFSRRTLLHGVSSKIERKQIMWDTRRLTALQASTACYRLPLLFLYSLWPQLWSSGQGSLLQIQRSGFYSRRYQIVWQVVGLKRGPLSLLGTTEEILERKSSGSGLECREYERGDPRHPSIRKS